MRELITDPVQVKALIDQFILMRDELGSFDPNIRFESFRLNLVGGETFLYKGDRPYLCICVGQSHTIIRNYQWKLV